MIFRLFCKEGVNLRAELYMRSLSCSDDCCYETNRMIAAVSQLGGAACSSKILQQIRPGLRNEVTLELVHLYAVLIIIKHFDRF